MHHTTVYGNTRRKANRYTSENGMIKLMYFSENLPGVNPVVINYKIRHDKNRPAMRPARYSVTWPYCFSIIICGGRKTWSGHATLHARIARALVNRSRLMNFAIPSQLRICKNKVANLM